jgi:secernin
MCALQPDRTLFAKNSDRPPDEVQLVEAHAPRARGGRLRTQYLEIDDPGAVAVVGARPDWLWGFEHGVNEHRVAIGNEQVWTVADATARTSRLIGMDLVRLALESATDADHALDLIATHLATEGQGGVANAAHDEAYFSSFLVADPSSAWVIETCGSTWAARPVEGGASISNRLSLSTDWTRASADVEPGMNFDWWRNPRISTDHADVRLAATRSAVVTHAASVTPADLAATLRDHGSGPWGAPGESTASAPPDTRQVTVCMHLPDYSATTSSLIAELHRDPEASHRAWVSPGSPCVGVFVPIFPPAGLPDDLAAEGVWRQFAALRDRVVRRPEELAEVREVLGPLEASLWAEADELAERPDRRARYGEDAGRRVLAALERLTNHAT